MTHFNDKLLQIGNQQQIAEFLRAPTIALAEFLTAVLSAPDSARLAAGHIVQAALKGRLFEQLGKEIEELRTAGRIKEDYFATHNQQATLHDLLKFIDESPPDEELFKALKSVFFCAVAAGTSAQDELKAYQILQVCKELRSGNILLLKACWKLYEEDPQQLKKMGDGHGGPISFIKWTDIMAEKVALPAGLVDVHTTKLEDLKLLSARTPAGAINWKNCRLSSFGLEMCQYITRF